MRDNKVQSVTRAIQLMTLIAEQPMGVTVGRLSAQSGLHKSTVSRLILTLEAAGAVKRLNNQATLHIDPIFAEQFAPHHQSINLRTIAKPYVAALSEHFDEAAALALPEADLVVLVDQVSPDLAIQVKDWSGSRYPLHTASAGKLFLAYRSAEEQQRYLSQPLAAYTQNTVTDPAQLRRSFAEIRSTGVSWIFNEFADDLTGVAAPLFDQQQSIVAALVVYAPSYRFPANPNQLEAINMMLLDSAMRCSAEIQTQLR